MTDPRPRKTFWKALGPGLLWAGAAIGVSHLVQSTRAGATFGFGLLVVALAANVFKYPAFSFGPRYAAATGTSLLEGYRRRGRWALILYAILTAGTMFTIQAVVTLVTGMLGSVILGWRTPWLGVPSFVWVSAALTVTCAGLLAVGRYRWLDKIVKVVIVVLTISTFAATALVLPRIPWGEMTWLPTNVSVRDLAFVVALIGWMPSAFDISIWHSLWTIARRKETRHAPSVREALIDFNVGYLGTALLAFCFLTLGAGVLYVTSTAVSPSAVVFASQIIDLYGETLGDWSRPFIGVSAFTVMFSTTLTVIDGFPRAISCLIERFRGPENPEETEETGRTTYWIALAGLGVGSILVIYFGTGGASGKSTFKSLVDVATTLSFVTAAALAWLNHRAMTGDEVPREARPGPKMVAYSWAGIVFSAGFVLFWLYTTIFQGG